MLVWLQALSSSSELVKTCLLRDGWREIAASPHDVRLPDSSLRFPERVPNGAALTNDLSHSVPVRMKDLTPEQFSSVPCPMCGVAAGKRCLLHSGAMHSEPH